MTVEELEKKIEIDWNLGFDVDKWMYYLNTVGISIINPLSCAELIISDEH